VTDLLDPDAMPRVLATLFATRHNTLGLVAGVNDDDCAVLPFGQRLLVLSTDYVNANPIAIEFGIGDRGTVGRLAVAANLADIRGTGAVPRCLLLAVVMPRDSDTAAFRLLVEGAKMEAERWGVPVVGGDTKLGHGMAVCGTAVGEAGSEEELFPKYRARPGDGLWVSGSLGSCSAAVLGLTDKCFDKEWEAWAKSVLTVPKLPFAQSRATAALGLSCAGTDISDGLGTDLAQVCEASGVGAVIELGAIPVHIQAARVAEAMSLPRWSMAFGVGGEFQFLVTAPPSGTAGLEAAGLHRIGEVTAKRGLRGREPGGEARPIQSAGHRDGRRMTFVDEVRHLVGEANHGEG
jgi:thiamine-monophosphate kinase